MKTKYYSNRIQSDKNRKKITLFLSYLFFISLTTPFINASAQCTNSSKYPSGSITAPAPNNTVTISTVLYTGGEYSQIASIVAGRTYMVSSSRTTETYITVRRDSYNGPVVAYLLFSLQIQLEIILSTGTIMHHVEHQIQVA